MPECADSAAPVTHLDEILATIPTDFVLVYRGYKYRSSSAGNHRSGTVHRKTCSVLRRADGQLIGVDAARAAELVTPTGSKGCKVCGTA